MPRHAEESASPNGRIGEIARGDRRSDRRDERDRRAAPPSGCGWPISISQQRFRDLLRDARQANVAFYPISPAGLQGIPFTRAGRLRHGRVSRPAARAPTRCVTLASETDGIAIVNTNDLAGGMRRIANDLQAYYVLGYYTTNTTWDGRRAIDQGAAEAEADTSTDPRAAAVPRADAGGDRRAVVGRRAAARAPSPSRRADEPALAALAARGRTGRLASPPAPRRWRPNRQAYRSSRSRAALRNRRAGGCHSHARPTGSASNGQAPAATRTAGPGATCSTGPASRFPFDVPLSGQ